MLYVSACRLREELAVVQAHAKNVLEQIDRVVDEVMQDSINLQKMREQAYDRGDAATRLRRCPGSPCPPASLPASSGASKPSSGMDHTSKLLAMYALSHCASIFIHAHAEYHYAHGRGTQKLK